KSSRRWVGDIQEGVALRIHPTVIDAELRLGVRQEFESADNVTGVNSGDICVKGGCTSLNRPDYGVWRQTVEVAADTIAPHAAGYKLDIAALVALPQINQNVAENAAGYLGMGSERGPAHRKNRNLLRSLDATAFPVEVMSSHEIGVIGKFGQHVRPHVGCARSIGGIIKLPAKLSIENKRKYDFASIYELLRVLNSCRPHPVIVEVIGGAEFGRTRVVVSHSDARILLVSKREVSRVRRNSNPVGRLQAPGLSTKKLPFVTLKILPIQAQTIGMAIGGDEDVPGIVAIEVKFDITGHIVLAKLGRSLDVEPRILTGRTVFRQVALHSVAEGNGAKAGR